MEQRGTSIPSCVQIPTGLTYVLYAPFALALSEPNYAARAAASVFDLLTAVGLFLLGRNLREGEEETRLGFVLAYAWASFPYAFFVTAWAYNDAMVALFLVAAMLAIASPLRRGLAVGPVPRRSSRRRWSCRFSREAQAPGLAARSSSMPRR